MKNLYFTSQIKLIALFVVLTAFTTTVKAQQYTLTDNDVVVTDGVIQSCSYNFEIKDIVIPETLNGQTVVGIKDNYNWNEGVFNNKGVVKITLPNTIKTIGENAFSDNQLTCVTIPNSVVTIGWSAFSDNQLTIVTLPNTLKTIGDYAFSSNQLTSVTIPNSVVTIGSSAFSSNQLTSVTIPNSVVTIGSWAFSGNKLTSVTIPNSITSIGNHAFRRNQLTSVTIPNSVTSIGSYAFEDNQLTSVTIPNSVVTIGECAFYENQLTSVTIPNSVVTIGNCAFYKNQLTSVIIPNSVVTIGRWAFAYNKLTSVTIPSNVTRIGEGAFASNSGLTSMLLPTPVISGLIFINWIDTKGNSFNGGATVDDFEAGYTANIEYTLKDNDVVVTNGIIKSCSYDFTATSIIIPETLDGQTVKGVDDGGYNTGVFKSKGLISVKYPFYFDTIGDSEFDDNILTRIPLMLAKVGIYAFQYNKLTELKIPGSVSIISSGAFSNNKISKLTIDYGVTEIHSYAFEDNKLTEVKIPATVNNIGSRAFKDNQLTNITLPVVDKLGYQFKGWKNGNGDVIEGNTAVSNLETSYSAILEPYKFTIKGKVSGAEGIEVKMSGDAQETVSLNDGQEYSFTVNYGQSVKVVASKTGYSFEPAEFSFETIQSDKTDNNFTATLCTYAVTFNVTDGTNPITGATVTFNGASYTTNSTGVVVIENVKPGNYPYTIKANGFADKSGNITVSTEKVTTVIPLSKLTVIDSVNGLNVSVYPNPTNNTLFIELPADNNIASVNISDITGKVLYQAMNITDKVISVDVSKFNSGILIVKVTNNKGVSDIRKVIKK